VIVHPAAALLTIGLFIIHVYMGAVLEEGAWAAIARGYVSRAWAKEHHRLWYEQIAKGTSARK
jgi:formate dehydrogenase subunit gamma